MTFAWKFAPKWEPPLITRPLRKRLLYNLQEGRCPICGEAKEFSEMTKDHYVPRAHGGSSSRENIQLACGDCNSRKGAQKEYPQKFKPSWLKE